MKNGRNINSEFDYRNIKFTDDIEKIIEVLSSDNKYTFYFKFTEYFDEGCLVQLETLEESNKVISEWDDGYYDEFMWDEPEERGVGGTEDEFDNTKEFIQVGYVECVNLHEVIKPEGFRESFLNLVRKFKDNNPGYLQELIDLSVDGEQGDSDPGCYEEEFLYDSLEIDYDNILYHQYLTEGEPYDGYKVTFLRYCQGNVGGEQFKFGYIEK
tara:strand:- start:116 stop:751 length:636 start_codon:yes stop_codon:yes gene_type:complete